MRPFERREAARRGLPGRFPYFKLARWNSMNGCFHDIAQAHPSEAAAKACAVNSGRYRISRIEEAGLHDLEPFDVP